MKKSKIILAGVGMMFLVACAKDTGTSTETSAEIAAETSTEAVSAVEPSETSAEAASEENSQAALETESETASQTAPETASEEQEQIYEYPSEDAGPVQEISRLGYSMTYDPTVFTLDDTAEDLDIYTYNTSEVLDGPAYITVQSYPDMDSQTLAEGIALQSGQDGVSVQDTYFGADGLSAKNIYYEEDVNGVTQAHAFYVLPQGAASLLIEITGYIDMPQQIEAKFEEMTGTFTLLN